MRSLHVIHKINVRTYASLSEAKLMIFLSFLVIRFFFFCMDPFAWILAYGQI